VLTQLLFLAACQSTGQAGKAVTAEPLPTAKAPIESWQCRNELEISCNAERCEAAVDFTPMSVTFDDSGWISVCAYSGCSEGSGTVTRGGRFILLTGLDLPFRGNSDCRLSR